MAAAETARLIAELSMKDNKFSSGIDHAIGKIGKLEGSIGRLGGIAQKGTANALTNITRLGILAGAGIAGGVALGIRSLSDLERTVGQTNAVIASTGGVAGISAVQVRALANALEGVTTVDDKVIQDGENMLLTFTGIGEKVFPRASKAALNMAVAMAKGDVSQVDMQASAVQLGKALNDPVKGITALSKVGVAFTKQQKDQIKAMVASGDVVGAQTIILKELETEFGKAGEAAGKGPLATWRRLQDVGEDLSQSLARGLLPVLTKAGDWLRVKMADPEVIRAIDQLGQSLGAVGEGAFQFIEKLDFKAIGAGLSVAAEGAHGIVSAFMGMPEWVKIAVLSGWGLNKLTGGALGDLGKLGLKLVVDQFAARGSSPANPVFVADIAGGGAGGPLGKGAGLGLAALAPFAALIAVGAGEILVAEALGPAVRDALGIPKGGTGRTQQVGPLTVRFGGSDAALFHAALQRAAPRAFDDVRKPTPVAHPGGVDSPRTSPASLAAIEAILARGKAAGFHPTLAAAQATNQKNLERLASAQIAAVEKVRDAVRASDGTSELVGIRNAVASAKPPVTYVTVNNFISGDKLQAQTVIRRRSGPSGGSRERGPTEFDI